MRTAALAAALAAAGIHSGVCEARPAARSSGAVTTISGSVTGLPPASSRVVLDVRAVSMGDGSVVASTAPRHGRFVLTVPKGGIYVLVAQALDLRPRHRGRESASRLVDAKGSRATAGLKMGSSAPGTRPAHRAAARTATVSPGAIGIGSIPVSAPAGSGAGSSAEGGLANGLLPTCKLNGRKLLDTTRYTDDVLQREQKLSDEGRTSVKTHYEALTPELNITGSMRVDASGKPVVDLTVKNVASGEVVDHVVTAGDPREDLSRFLERVGSEAARRECEAKEAPPAPTPPAPAPTPPPEPGPGAGHVRFTGSFSIAYSGGLEEKGAWTIEGTFSGATGEDVATLTSLSGSSHEPGGGECADSTWEPNPEELATRWSIDASERFPEPGWRYEITYPVEFHYAAVHGACGSGHYNVTPFNLMLANVPVSQSAKFREAQEQLAKAMVAPGGTISESRPFSYSGERNGGGTVEEEMTIGIEANARF